jgi:hypothetical protein
MLKYHRNSDICKYKKQRNRVNNLKKIAKENFETLPFGLSSAGRHGHVF